MWYSRNAISLFIYQIKTSLVLFQHLRQNYKTPHIHCASKTYYFLNLVISRGVQVSLQCVIIMVTDSLVLLHSVSTWGRCGSRIHSAFSAVKQLTKSSLPSICFNLKCRPPVVLQALIQSFVLDVKDIAFHMVWHPLHWTFNVKLINVATLQWFVSKF